MRMVTKEIYRGTIRISGQSEGFIARSENFQESLNRLEKFLIPGSLVFIRDTSHGRMMFFTDGKITQDRQFSIQKGKRYYSYIGEMTGRMTDHSIISTDMHILPSEPIQTPIHYPRSPYRFLSGLSGNRREGIAEIFIGDFLREEYPHWARELEFARNAMRFRISDTYLSPEYLRLSKEPDDQIAMRNRLIRRCNGVSVVRRLLKQLVEEQYDAGLMLQIVSNQPIKPVSNLYTIEYGHYSQDQKRSFNEKYPDVAKLISDNDFLIESDSRLIAVVKVDTGTRYDDMYVLPVRNEEFIENALSDESVKKIYPDWSPPWTCTG
jgi:hypothetical protein